MRPFLTAMQRVVQLPKSILGVSGSEYLLECVRRLWKQSERQTKVDNLSVSGNFDARLFLHSDNSFGDAFDVLNEIFDFQKEVNALLDGSISLDERSAKIHELYYTVVRSSRAAASRDSSKWKLSWLRQRRKNIQRGAAKGRPSGSYDNASSAGAGSVTDCSDAGSDSDAQSSRSVSRRGSLAFLSDDGGSDCGASVDFETGSEHGSATTSVAFSNASSRETHVDSEDLLARVTNHLRDLQKLLIFDVWRDFLASKEGKHLMSVLLASDQMQERRLGEQIEICCALLPKDVDSWMRMFISCVQDVEPMGVCICDMSIAYAPIIHVNKGWRSMTGYTSEDAVGRSCRFLQGPSTSEESVASIRDAIRTGTRAVVRLVNYRKDGSLFNNMLTLRPIFDDAGHMVFMVAISVAVSNSFKRMKPLLTQLNRLNHLLPERLNLPAVASVRRRLSLGHGAMLKRRAAMLRKQQDAPPVGGEKERPDAWMKARHQLTVVTDVAVKKAQERVAERQREKMQQGSLAASPALSTPSPGTASKRVSTSQPASSTPSPATSFKRVSTSQASSSLTEGQTLQPKGSRKLVLNAMSAHPASSAYQPWGKDLRMSATKRPTTAGKTPTLPMLMPGSKDTPSIHRASLPASSPASSPQPPKGSLSPRGPAPGRQRFISEHIPTPPKTPKSARVTRQP